MIRQLNPAAVREFVQDRMGGYYRAVADGRRQEWLREFADEVAALTNSWDATEAADFNEIVRDEMQSIRMEMRMQGPQGILTRYGVEMPSRRTAVYLVVWVALFVIIVALIVSILSSYP